MYDVIILGSGPAGFTAAIYAVRAGHKTLVIAGTAWGGQLMMTTLVENFPGFPDGIQGPQLMTNMRKQAERLGAEIVNADFTMTDFSQKTKKVTAGGKTYEGKSIIVSTGASNIWLGVPGEAELRGRGVSSCATCDAFFFRGKKVIIAGGGDSAMEEAHVLAQVASSVIVVHRRGEFRASKAMQEKIFKDPKIKIIWNTQITKFNGEQRLESVDLATTGEIDEKKIKEMQGKILSKKEGQLGWNIPIDGVFVAIGHKPNTVVFKDLELDAKGYIVKKEVFDKEGKIKYKTATNIGGVFVAGDVNDALYKQAIVASGLGCMAALDASRWLDK